MMTSTTQNPPGYAVPPQQVVTTVNQSRPGNWKGLNVTGIIQVVLGSLTIILGIVTVTAFDGAFFTIGSPIWCGLLFYITAGTLGIVSGVQRKSGVVIGYLVMSILACLAACVVIGFRSGTMASVNAGCAYIYGYYPSYCNARGGRVAVDAMLVILGLAEFVVSIVGASLTCSSLCNTAPAHTVINYQAQPQVVIAGQPQGMVYYSGPTGPQQLAYPPQQVVGSPQGQFAAASPDQYAQQAKI